MKKKVAYLILAHNDPHHLGSLVKSISNHADVYIHLDLKADLSEFIDKCPTQATFIEKRVSVAWAGISMVDALLNLIEAALPYADRYTHFIFITGSDYPIKSENEISSVFVSSPKKQFLKYIDMRQSDHYLKLISRKHFMEPLTTSRNKIMMFLDRFSRAIFRRLSIANKWNNCVTPHFGHTWCALTPECCRYILDFHNQNPWFYQMNKDTFAPDEHYFHTIVGNSPFAAYADGIQVYEGRGLWRVVNFHLICPSLKKWFSLDDWDQVRESNKLFVRKINSKSGAELIRKIDIELLNR